MHLVFIYFVQRVERANPSIHRTVLRTINRLMCFCLSRGNCLAIEDTSPQRRFDIWIFPPRW